MADLRLKSVRVNIVSVVNNGHPLMAISSVILQASLALLVLAAGAVEAASTLKPEGSFQCVVSERCEVLAVGPLPDKGVAVLIAGKSQGQTAGVARIVVCAAGGKSCRKVDEWPTESLLHRLDVSLLVMKTGVEILTKDSESNSHLRSVDQRGTVSLRKLPFSLGARLVASDGQRRTMVRGYASGIGMINGDLNSDMQVLHIVDGIDIENVISLRQAGSDAIYARLLPSSTAEAPKAVVERLSRAGVLRCKYTVDGVPDELAAVGASEVLLFNNIGDKGDNFWSVGFATCASSKVISKTISQRPEKIKSVALACSGRCVVGILTRSRFEVLGIALQANELNFASEVEFSVPAGEILSGLLMAADSNDTVVATFGTIIVGRDLISSIKIFRIAR